MTEGSGEGRGPPRGGGGKGTMPERPLVETDLGIKGEIQQLKGTFKIEGGRAIVRIDMIEGKINNPLEIITNLKNVAQSRGASTLRIEALLANERLWQVLIRRYGLKTANGIDFIEIPIE